MGAAARNAMRSGLVIIGALAFGYLSTKLIFQPYLEKAQLYNNNNSDHHSLHHPSDQLQQQQQDSIKDTAAVILDDGRTSS